MRGWRYFASRRRYIMVTIGRSSARDFGNGGVPVKAHCTTPLVPQRREIEALVIALLALLGPLLEGLGAHASVRGQRDGCQQDAGSMQFRCAHLMIVLGPKFYESCRNGSEGRSAIARRGMSLRDGRRKPAAVMIERALTIIPID